MQAFAQSPVSAGCGEAPCIAETTMQGLKLWHVLSTQAMAAMMASRAR